MPGHHLLPCLPERPRIEILQPATELVEISGRLRLVQGLEEQTQLHRRETVNVFNILAAPDEAIQFLLCQLSQRKIRGSIAARLCTTAMRDDPAQTLDVAFRYSQD